ncbi:MAG: hypothetical protein ACOH1Y_06080 [Propionicimonas sp.]
MDDLERSAYHEAGHAVATVLRGRKFLRLVSIAASIAHRGNTLNRSPGWNDAFVAWSGPWAQAHAEWSERPLDGDDKGCTLDDDLAAAFLNGGQEDHHIVEQHFASMPWPSMRSGTERVWAMELTRMWPAITQVAEWLLGGERVSDQRIRDLTYIEMAFT